MPYAHRRKHEYMHTIDIVYKRVAKVVTHIDDCRATMQSTAKYMQFELHSDQIPLLNLHKKEKERTNETVRTHP